MAVERSTRASADQTILDLPYYSEYRVQSKEDDTPAKN